MDLITERPQGLYCAAGDFYIDPWQPVDRALITHAHGDHARTGSRHYLAAAAGAPVLRTRLGDVDLQTLEYGQSLLHHGVKVSFHPAGHVLGSAQIRLEVKGEVWVVSGDYKTEPDPTCAPFEPVRCDTFVTESTFGLPIYRWPSQRAVFDDIDNWWRANAATGRVSVLFCYSFGKAQRILAGIDSSIGPIAVHGAVAPLNAAYLASGVALPATSLVRDLAGPTSMRGALVLAPPSAQGTTWMRRFGDYSDAFASGWMHVRGARRRRGTDRGFVLSDHADWPGLNSAIAATGASSVRVTHGSVATMVRWLREHGLDAQPFATEYGDEETVGPDGPGDTDAEGSHAAGAKAGDTDADADVDADADADVDALADADTDAPARIEPSA